MMETAEQLIVSKILSAVDTYQASDLHLSVGNPPMMRVRGRLVAVPDQPILTPDFVERLVLSWLSKEQAKQLEEKKDYVFSKTFPNRKRFKISLFYQQGYLSASLALIPDVILSFEELGFPPSARRILEIESGLVLIIGPFGSERSTTVASFIEHLNRTTQKHIVTIEQPIEYLFRDHQCVIEQREVGTDVKSVEEGLTFALDEDVDVIMISDLSTAEAFRKALEVANSGKMMIAILHATSIVSALNFIIHRFDGADQEQIRSELAIGLAGIIDQRSVMDVNGDRVLIAGVMIPNDNIRTIIQKGEMFQINNILLTSREPGMSSLDMALRAAVDAGRITRQEAAKHAVNPSTFQ